jgi:hypothetical protein
MHAHDRLRNLIDQEGGRLRADIPSDREAAIVALVRAQDRLAAAIPTYPASDLITGRRLPNLGGGIALRLCLEAAGAATVTPADIDRWADAFLAHCERVARAKLVLGHGETGFMRIVDREDGSVDAWIASARPPVSWRERADIDWWADHLARTSGSEDAAGRVDRMAYQLGYPDDAVLGGVPVSMWRRVVTRLIERAARAMDRGDTTPVCGRNALTADLAEVLGIDLGIAANCLDGLALDADNAGWHASVPGVAAPPLVRIDADRIALSWHGLISDSIPTSPSR